MGALALTRADTSGSTHLSNKQYKQNDGYSCWHVPISMCPRANTVSYRNPWLTSYLDRSRWFCRLLQDLGCQLHRQAGAQLCYLSYPAQVFPARHWITKTKKSNQTDATILVQHAGTTKATSSRCTTTQHRQNRCLHPTSKYRATPRPVTRLDKRFPGLIRAISRIFSPKYRRLTPSPFFRGHRSLCTGTHRTKTDNPGRMWRCQTRHFRKSSYKGHVLVLANGTAGYGHCLRVPTT